MGSSTMAWCRWCVVWCVLGAAACTSSPTPHPAGDAIGDSSFTGGATDAFAEPTANASDAEDARAASGDAGDVDQADGDAEGRDADANETTEQG